MCVKCSTLPGRIALSVMFSVVMSELAAKYAYILLRTCTRARRLGFFVPALASVTHVCMHRECVEKIIHATYIVHFDHHIH